MGPGEGGLPQGHYGLPPKPADQMDSKESEEEHNEDNSIWGKLKSFFGRGKKKDDDTNRIVGFGMPAFDLVTTGAD